MVSYIRDRAAGVAAVLCLIFIAWPTWAHDASSTALLYDQPVLTVDPGMHTGFIRSISVDAAGQFAVTGSEDKTVRIWSVADGRLLRTIRMPAGPGSTGKIYAVAMSPDANLIAAGGWTLGDDDFPIYIFDRSTGRMIKRVIGIEQITFNLAFSADGRYLAAVLGGESGLRVYDRHKDWAETFRDDQYDGDAHGVTFAPDGRLATTSTDGKVRLYSTRFRRKGSIYRMINDWKSAMGEDLFNLAFRPDGKVIAVGHAKTPEVDLLDGKKLGLLAAPRLRDIPAGDLPRVAWSNDGKTLFAGGACNCGGRTDLRIVAWTEAGHGEPRGIPIAQNTIGALLGLPGGRLLVATAAPALSVLNADDSAFWVHTSPIAEFGGQADKLKVSEDGYIVDFGFEKDGNSPLRFNLRDLRLTQDPPVDTITQGSQQNGLPVEDWYNSSNPTLSGNPIEILENNISRSLTIHPDWKRFVLGTSWSIEAFDADGAVLWSKSVPGEAFALNIPADGRTVVAAYSDGTIRWHRMDDGRELLALLVLSDRSNWVAWTPEGFYAATPGAQGVLQWHDNQGSEAAATTVPVHEIQGLYRPDALPLILQQLETARALGLADTKAARRAVQVATRAAKAPGPRLHVLAIGISDYGHKARHLHLDYAREDARDVAGALVSAQRGGLYADVMPMILESPKVDQESITPDRDSILSAFSAMRRNMARGLGQDLAVIFFSGHGAVIEGSFYILPYGVDAGGAPDRLKSGALSASDFRAEIKGLAQHGRVLVLLDACHSGAVTEDGSILTANADALRSLLAQSNVTVLTSSVADKVSREDKRWGHGAFTKVLLGAFGRVADTNHDGVISMSELTAYMARELPALTGGEQHPGIEQRFEGNILAVVL